MLKEKKKNEIKCDTLWVREARKREVVSMIPWEPQRGSDAPAGGWEVPAAAQSAEEVVAVRGRVEGRVWWQLKKMRIGFSN